VRVPLLEPPSSVEPVLRETDELIRIVKSSMRTACDGEVKEESCEYRVAE
jgi:hypothetical protein